MSKADSCPTAPYTEWTVKITFEAYRQRWLAEHWATTVTGDGDAIRHGNALREFGPFDSFTDVQHWLASEARVLKLVGDPLKWSDGNGGHLIASPTDNGHATEKATPGEAQRHV